MDQADLRFNSEDESALARIAAWTTTPTAQRDAVLEALERLSSVA